MENLPTILHNILGKNIVRFTYKKVNGEIRHAVGTRNLDIARAKTGEYIPNPKGEEQPNSYYDTEKMGWRSYKPELLISIDGVIPVEYVDLREIPVEKMPSHTDNLPMSEILKGLFGGIGNPISDEFIIGNPPYDKADTPLEDFAKVIAHYVVEELVERITR